jgi:hypothetical protein
MKDPKLTPPCGASSVEYMLASLLIGLSLLSVLRHDWPDALSQFWQRFSFFLSIPFV